MRVLHIIGAMDRGGAETMIMNLYREIDHKKVQFDFLVHEERQCDYDKEIKKLGGKLYRLPRFTGFNFMRYRRLCREFFEEHPEHQIIHGHIGSCAALYFAEAKRAGRIMVAHSHAQDFPLSLSQIIFNIVSYPTRFIADQFLACSREAGRDRFGKHVVESGPFYVLNNAIDIQAYACDELAHQQAKAALGFSDVTLMGHVGRLDGIKNHIFLFEVFKRLLQDIPDAKLLLVGRGPLEEELRMQAKEDGLEDAIIFCGVRNDVASVLKSLDVFVFPSFREGLSMAAVEAQTAGVPCIVSTGVPENAVIREETVRLSLADGAEVWACEAIRLLNTAPVRTQGAEVAQQNGYDIAETAQWLARFYGELLSGDLDCSDKTR